MDDLALIRQNPKLSAITVSQWRIAILAGLTLLAIIGIGTSSCSIKRTIKTNVPQKILQAKSATYDELLSLIKSYDRLFSLQSNDIRITFTSGKKESGQLQEFPRAPGYILLKRPDSMFLAVQMPITKSAILNLSSVGDEFCAWIPRELKFYTGENSAKELFVGDLPNSPGFTIRATHLFEAVLPKDLVPDSPGIRISLIEDSDAEASYYVLSIQRDGPSSRSYPIREVWIERSGLTLARHKTYLEDGQLLSDIKYSGEIQIDGFSLPLKIHIDRPTDGYTLDMEFKKWSVNPELPDEVFLMKPPPGAQVIALRQK